ncbi:MAG: DUF4390 domain-containing protein [Gammaproteobacteria bacterium]|nr:DUF4390 domain-containing protein [Gammaproteobacteria bacterium]
MTARRWTRAILCSAWSAAAAALLACVAVVRADVLDGVLAVRSAYISVGGGVFELHARVQYPVNDEIRTALHDGSVLLADLDVSVARERRFWFDAEVVSITLRRELSFHTVSDRYVVRDVRSGIQRSFPTLEEALAALGAIDGVPILVEPQLSNEARYRVSVRAGIRRGHLPDALRRIMFWSDDWHRASEWYAWSLPR